MVEKVLGKFSVHWRQVLDGEGRADAKLMPKLTGSIVRDMHHWMVVSRAFDEKCLVLQRQGRMGTYASLRGQEAAQVGSAIALGKKDWMFPSFRENAANLVRGVPAENIMAYWAGDERGERIPEGVNNFTCAIPVGTQIPHAVGCAWGMRLKGNRAASLVYFGDGATSKGDFHEGLNLAGVFRLPAVFLCQNNQWAISLPFERQTAASTIAQKAVAYGFPGIRVDGNDVFAVYSATKQALERAYSGKGPTLIEAFTYRVEHHTTADDSTRYRSKKEVDSWRRKDPIERLEKWMLNKKLLTPAARKKTWEEARKGIEKVVERMEAIPEPKVADMFDFVYEKLSPGLEEQKKGAGG